MLKGFVLVWKRKLKKPKATSDKIIKKNSLICKIFKTDVNDVIDINASLDGAFFCERP